MKNFSIGIDFSKKTFDATILHRDNDDFKELGFSKFNNDPQGFKDFEKWVRCVIKVTAGTTKKSEWLFCGEHTGTCSIALCDFLAKKKYFMWLESALVIHRKCGIVRVKNDRIDSKRIAEYALRNFSSDVQAYELDSEHMRKLKSLYAAHNMLTKDKVRIVNQLKSNVLIASNVATQLMREQLKTIKEGLEKIDDEIQQLLADSEEFSANYKILLTFKGVGPLTAACLIVKTRNFKDMTNSREFGSYAGIVPHQCQSGTSIDKPPHTSYYRDRQTNAALSCCMTSAIMHNPVIEAYYQRLIQRGVNIYKAKNNCKFKIIHILLTMIRNRAEFDINKYGKTAKQWHNLSA